MFEYIILGIVQGIAEWLPISSEGFLFLTKTTFFPSDNSVMELIEIALLLHIGTFLAAFCYFFKDVKTILLGCYKFKTQDAESQGLIKFLFISTVISGILGLVLLKVLINLASQLEHSASKITFAVGCLLLITAFLEIRAKKGGKREIKDIVLSDSIILGLTQSFAALPGLSRSGLTVSALLLKKFDKTAALKLSFLMSLPIVLFGNIILNTNSSVITAESLVGVLFAFIFGLLTIHGLLIFARKVNFGYFLLFFGLLTMLSTLIK